MELIGIFIVQKVKNFKIAQLIFPTTDAEGDFWNTEMAKSFFLIQTLKLMLNPHFAILSRHIHKDLFKVNNNKNTICTNRA